MSTPTHITSAAQLRSILSAHNVVVADFYADWCGPCKAIAPAYEQFSKSLSKPGKVAFVKVNTDDQQDIARKYEITAMPTFLIFKESREVKRIRGADARALKEAIDTVIAGAGSAGSGASFGTKGHTLGPAPTAPKYVSGGRIVGDVPLTAQLNGFMNTAMRFVGLYVVSLFSLDAYAAAEASSYNVNNRDGQRARPAAGR
ncbi:MAG: hypothetical protein M1839_009520 [Geoglossum umbratile]|nr:MAG: hypothetical protein M1839_009520 [Geoglossum umbratile]